MQVASASMRFESVSQLRSFSVNQASADDALEQLCASVNSMRLPPGVDDPSIRIAFVRWTQIAATAKCDATAEAASAEAEIERGGSSPGND